MTPLKNILKIFWSWDNEKRKNAGVQQAFDEIGVKVIVRTPVRPLTVSDNPNYMQPIPNFAERVARWWQAGTVRLYNKTRK